MTYERLNEGTCSVLSRVELADDLTVRKLEVVGGCDGNLQGIMKLVQGMPAEEAIRRLKGIRCGDKPTSCPDQIALALEGALAKARH
jgi:uncharacterized protein (TIGR03905 family)